MDRGPVELARAVLEFDDAAVDSAACVHNAGRFHVASFRRAMFARGRRPRYGDGFDAAAATASRCRPRGW